ncbi:pyridoxine/pyridoxal/pyridoxamine kinase [Paenibacillus polymyxa]|uniref:pyridoxine/pyridoxal/pyridoxamine kinase n=1 Tax=Paenibacillus TaxID=44249 RepID=UPI0020B77213|nr:MULTISPECIES: pyridoxine/pyridoxal/pyridoxamine kinase [Paenibacillus]MCP3781463.1 pyridoxine/pyridoxal/pyridoxamine kinase [Paenibacillus sp. MZ03-122A]MCP3809945.1 pyridoxine/pyridoxal/pyridoxamine kinase [Paenibacillus sp. Lou8.1]MDY7991004.1 pyridoxine/pyridoxal/pyridoxamine kinase [Paenibacillus polymyxa]MDY8120117.1 pyridoxine/pyridoxal/pyridoxamine kinase [Paenibacillus polymyxa]
MEKYKVLTIAGSDSSGGAGIQADLKTFQELDVYGMTALTTIVTMDPNEHWKHNILPLGIMTVKEQLRTILEGIGVEALKTGMLGSVQLIELVSDVIEQYQLDNVIVDPVLICKGVTEVIYPETIVSLRESLIPKATIVTPNLLEAAHLSMMEPIKSIEGMKKAAKIIYDLGPKYVLVKGGSRLEHETALDLLYDGENFEFIQSERFQTSHIHGAGCTYSAAITAELAKGKSVIEAVRTAKLFITEAIRGSFALNQFVGSTNHSAYKYS